MWEVDFEFFFLFIVIIGNPFSVYFFFLQSTRKSNENLLTINECKMLSNLLITIYFIENFVIILIHYIKHIPFFHNVKICKIIFMFYWNTMFNTRDLYIGRLFKSSITV